MKLNIAPVAVRNLSSSVVKVGSHESLCTRPSPSAIACFLFLSVSAVIAVHALHPLQRFKRHHVSTEAKNC